MKRVTMLSVAATMILTPCAHAQTDNTSDTLQMLEPTTSSLLTLPPVEPEQEAPLKDPSLARDFETTEPVSPDVERPVIYWGDVGHRSGYPLATIMRIAWKANPNWNTYAANHALAHAALVEACAFPNPEIDMEYGSESADAGGSANIWSLGFSQPIELPGKRRARQAEAMAGFPVAQNEMLQYASTLKTDVREAYWTVQYHAAIEQMHATQVELTEKQLTLAKHRQELGDAGKIEVTNARVELLKSQREREVSRRKKLGAKAALNALAGGALDSEFQLSQNFPHNYERPNLAHAVQKALTAHPRLATLAAKLEQKYAGIQRQRREWWPDVNIGARKSREFDGDSAAITAAIEIPLWNRNEGGIARAEAEAQKTYAEITVAYNELRRDVEVAYQNLMLAREQISSFENGLKDASEKAVDLTWEQLQLGGGGYLDILIARRQLIEVQQGYIKALYDAATFKARFDQAAGN